MIIIPPGPCDERPVVLEIYLHSTEEWKCSAYEDDRAEKPMVYKCSHQAAHAVAEVIHIATISAMRGDLEPDSVPHVKDFRVIFVDAVPSELAADEPDSAAVHAGSDFLTRLIGKQS